MNLFYYAPCTCISLVNYYFIFVLIVSDENTLFMNGKAVGVLIGGRGNLDLTEANYEGNNLHKIFYIVC